jgi:DNA-binding response OmpR family regulator
MAFAAVAIRVLIVEPHDDTRELYRLWMSSLGWQVVTASDGASATVALGAGDPAVVVSEMRLPDRGVEALLAAAATGGVPVIGLTTAPSNHRRASDARVSVLLMKPCLPDEVVAAIRAVLPPSSGI